MGERVETYNMDGREFIRSLSRRACLATALGLHARVPSQLICSTHDKSRFIDIALCLQRAVPCTVTSS